jgi:hypothetical protein
MHKLTFTYTTCNPENIFGTYNASRVGYKLEEIDETQFITYMDKSPVDILEYSEDFEPEAYTEYYFGVVDDKEVAIYTSHSKNTLIGIMNQHIDNMEDVELIPMDCLQSNGTTV